MARVAPGEDQLGLRLVRIKVDVARTNLHPIEAASSIDPVHPTHAEHIASGEAGYIDRSSTSAATHVAINTPNSTIRSIAERK